MAYHGIKVSEAVTTFSTPLVADSGIPFVVGTAPVQSVAAGKVNVPVLASSYAEAVAALGYSDDWKKYSLCEFMYAHFNLFGMSPVVFVNVLDPSATAMKREGRTLPLYIGEKGYGKYRWVIIKHQFDLERYDNKGNLLEADVNLSLKAYTYR